MDDPIPAEAIPEETVTAVEPTEVVESAPEAVEPTAEPILDTYHTEDGAPVEDAYLVQ